MALLVDSANALDGRAVIAAGYVGEIRYLSKFPAHVIRPAERDSNLEAGSDIVLVYEDQAYNQNVSDMVLGAQRGADNAYRAMKQAGDLGYPPGACIYFACDRPDPTYAQVKPYMDAVRPIITDSGWRVGFYGPMRPARGLLGDHTADKAWVVETWTDGGPLDPFHLLQLVGPLVVVGGTQCDEDQILQADYGGWLPHATQEVPPMYSPPLTLQPVVADLACPTGGAWLLAADGSVYAFGGAPYKGGANGQSYFTNRHPARLELPDGNAAAGSTYTIVATSGERYTY